MWKTKITFILIILLLGGLVLQTSPFLSGNQVSASNSYLPKADLIKGTGSEVYVLENGVRHWVPSPEIFEHFQAPPTELVNTYVLNPQCDEFIRDRIVHEGTLETLILLINQTSSQDALVLQLASQLHNPQILTGNILK